MTLPLFRGATTQVATDGPGGGLTRTWITGHQAGWTALIIGITAGEAVTLPTGFAHCPQSPQTIGPAGGPSAVTLFAAWRRADQATMDANGGVMPAFAPTQPDAFSGSFISWRGYFWSDVFDTGNPFLTLTAAAGNTLTPAATAVSIPAIDTTGFNDCAVIAIAAHAKDTSALLFDSTAWVNASLAGLTERSNNSTGAGSGGGWAVVTGNKAVAGAVNATTGLLTSASIQARLTLALRGAAAAASLPDSDFGCGAECGIEDTPVIASEADHWNGVVGALPISQTEFARNGGRAYRCSPDGDVSYLIRAVSGSQRVARAYIYFISLPTTDTELIRFRVASTGLSPEIRFRRATQDIVAAIGTTIGVATPVVVGVWYLVDAYANVGVTPRTLDLRINGVDKGQINRAVTPDVFSQFNIGASVDAITIADVAIDDIRIGPNPAAYPLGEGQIVGVQVTEDGVHSYDAEGDFAKDDTINLPVGATDAWTFLTGLLNTIISWLSAPLAAVAEYLEVKTTGALPVVTTTRAVEVVTTHRSRNTTGPNAQTLQMIDGATTVPVFTARSFTGTSVMYNSKHFDKAPSGVAWTRALFNALKLRWFRVSGVPGFGGIMFEVECTGLAAPPSEESEEVNPQHTFPGPGTYPVTLTVTDDDGLEAFVTHDVVIPS